MEEDNNEEKDKEWMAAYNLTENQVQGTVSTRVDQAYINNCLWRERLKSSNSSIHTWRVIWQRCPSS